jgi:hypothetical protein
LYSADQLDEKLKKDGTRFQDKMKELLDRNGNRSLPANYNPLVTVTHSYLDNPLTLAQAAGELGLASPTELHIDLFTLPQFTRLGLIPLSLEKEGVIRRDAWEDYYGQVVNALGLGVELPPLDGVLRKELQAGATPTDITFRALPEKKIWAPNDPFTIEVVNKTSGPLYMELIVTSPSGEMKVLTSPDLPPLKPGEKYERPSQLGPTLSKELVTLFASPEKFSPGEVVRFQANTNLGESAATHSVGDRVFHPDFERLVPVGTRFKVERPAVVVKKTLEIDTR